MNCEPIRGLLSAYLDDQLSASERQSVSAHLDACIECSALLSDYQRFDVLLAQLPYLTAPSSQPKHVVCHAPERLCAQNAEAYQKAVLTLVPLTLENIATQTPAQKNLATHIIILLLIGTLGFLLIRYLSSTFRGLAYHEKYVGR